MNNSNQMSPEYIERVNQVKAAVRGNYDTIARKAGVSYDTVVSVFRFKFQNKKVLKEAERLAKQLA